jgi:hypothetical protein
MINETDTAIYNKLDGIQVQGQTVPIHFFGKEEQFSFNEQMVVNKPHYSLQRFDITFADDRRWSPDDKTIEYNYAAGKAIIKEPDIPMYLYYQVDLMAMMQRDHNDLIEPLFQLLPPVGYLSVKAYGRNHVCGFVQTESQPLTEIEEVYKWRHAFRYRINIRLKNLTETELYLVMTRYIQERTMDDNEFLMRTIEIDDTD